MAEPESTTVLTGIEPTLTALKGLDKDAVKRFNAVLNAVLTDAERAARGFVKAEPPMSGWKTRDPLKPQKSTRGGAGFPAYNQGVIVQGIRKSKAEGKPRRGDYTTSAGALINESAAGAIIEVAGKKSGGTGSGIQFIRNLTDEIRNPSRLIWQAVDAQKRTAEIKVLKALDEAKATLQKHLDRERD